MAGLLTFTDAAELPSLALPTVIRPNALPSCSVESRKAGIADVDGTAAVASSWESEGPSGDRDSAFNSALVYLVDWSLLRPSQNRQFPHLNHWIQLRLTFPVSNSRVKYVFWGRGWKLEAGVPTGGHCR